LVSLQRIVQAGHWWLTPIILATQEAEISRIVVQSQLRQIVPQTLSRKTLHKNRAGGVAQGEGPEFKPQYLKKEFSKSRNQDLKQAHYPTCPAQLFFFSIALFTL
jgi:hypothetical protein